jgi:predicted AAA+ superfamily ATPase
MVKISEINAQNPWWSQGIEFARYDKSLGEAKPIFFKRKPIETKSGNIYILRGPRQVGKTTYIKDSVRRLIENGTAPRDILYLSLDFFTSRRELRNAINYFLESRIDAARIYLLLDEITSIDDWNLELKYLSDQGVLKRAIILATGSSAVKLKEKRELLPGRGVEGNEYYIKPLGFREFTLQIIDFVAQHLTQDEFCHTLITLKTFLTSCSLDLGSGMDEIQEQVEKILPFKMALSYLFHLYLTTGGLPGVVNHYLDNRYLQQKNTIHSAIAEIFVRDVFGDLARLQKQENIIRQIFRAIVERYGSRYSFSNLSREIEKSHITTIDYLELMEDSFICFVLYSYDFNTKNVKAKGDKKVYFFDPFVLHSVKSYLGGSEVWDRITTSLENEELRGQMVEGVVISHLRMYGEIPLMRTGSTFLWYYYDRSGKEIDAVFRGDERYLGIEVKYQNQVNERDIRRISPLKRYFILSKEDAERKKSLMIIPVDIFLALLPVSERNI